MSRPASLLRPFASPHRPEWFSQGADQIIDRSFSFGIPVSHENMDFDLLDPPPSLLRDPGQEGGHRGEAGGARNDDPIFGRREREDLIGLLKIADVFSEVGVMKPLFQSDLERKEGKKPERAGAMEEDVGPLAEGADLFFPVDIAPERNHRGAERADKIDRLLLLSAVDADFDIRKGGQAVENAPAENAGSAEENETIRNAAHGRLSLMMKVGDRCYSESHDIE